MTMTRSSTTYWRRRGFAYALATMLGVLAITMPTASHAGPSITGTTGAIQIAAGDVSIATLLSAIAAQHPLQYRSSVPLNDIVTGTYSGSLEEVIPHLLNGFDFFVMRNEDTIQVVIIGRHVTPAVAPQSPQSSTPPDCIPRKC